MAEGARMVPVIHYDYVKCSKEIIDQQETQIAFHHAENPLFLMKKQKIQ
jgi:hypothetical protein